MIRIYSTSVGAVSMYSSYIVQLYEYRTYTLYTVYSSSGLAYTVSKKAEAPHETDYVCNGCVADATMCICQPYSIYCIPLHPFHSAQFFV